MLAAIRDMLHRRPFQAFRVVVSSGDRYDVLDRHLLAIGQTQLVYCYPRTDRIAFVRMSEIASVEAINNA
jgi:hypothetical protein